VFYKQQQTGHDGGNDDTDTVLVRDCGQRVIDVYTARPMCTRANSRRLSTTADRPTARVGAVAGRWIGCWTGGEEEGSRETHAAYSGRRQQLTTATGRDRATCTPQKRPGRATETPSTRVAGPSYPRTALPIVWARFRFFYYFLCFAVFVICSRVPLAFRSGSPICYKQEPNA